MKLSWTPWCNTLVSRPEPLHNFSCRLLAEGGAVWHFAGPSFGCTGWAHSLEYAQEACAALYRGIRGGG